MVAAGQLLLHIFTNGRYGIFRDELYYLDCARHPAWGYVDHPPLSIWMLALCRAAFGDSVHAIRILSELAGAALIVVAAMIAREFGGGRIAQIVAALATAATPANLVETGYYSMNAFDLLIWAILFWILARLSARSDPRLWLWFGLAAGVGLLNKISVLFLGFGVVVAVLLTPLRRHFRHWQFHAGIAIAFALFVPYLLWNAANEWPTLEFMDNAKRLKIVAMAPLDFFGEQVLGMNPMLAPLWLAGLVWLLLPGAGGRFRIFGWCFLSVLLLLMASKSKPYYVYPAYTPLFAAGGCVIEQLVARLRRSWPAALAEGWIGLAGLLLLPIAVPLFSPEGFLRYQQTLGIKSKHQENNPVGEMPQYFADRFGWENLASSVASVYHTLSDAEKGRCAVMTTNYGEAGAINYYGHRFGLPRAISGHNNHYLWGPGINDPAVVIRVGGSEEELRQKFKDVRIATVIHSPYAMPYKSDLPVFVCRGLKVSWMDFWHSSKSYI